MSALTGKAKAEADKAPIKPLKKSAFGSGSGEGDVESDVVRINEMLGQKKSDKAITDDIFHRRHPDLGGRALAPKKHPGDKVLVKEWVAIWRQVKTARKNLPVQTMFFQLFDEALDALHRMNSDVSRREHGIRLLNAVENRKWQRKALNL